MEKHKYHLLMKVLPIFFLCFAWASDSFAKAAKKPASVEDSSVTVRVVERASRVELGSQKVELNLNAHPTPTELTTMGAAMAGYSVVVSSRPVSIDSKPGYLWLDVKLVDKAQQTVAYLTATVPQDKFDVGVGFTLPKDPKNQLVFMVDGSVSEQ
jgi:hypothetical protein